MTRPSPVPRARINTLDDALDWMEHRCGLYTGEIGDVCTLILGRWEERENAWVDAIARLQDMRADTARLRDFLGWVERELARSDAEWAQVEAMAARMDDEAETVLNPENDDDEQTSPE